MPTFTATDYPKDIECSICLDVWNDAVECNPCKHIFCRGCIRQLDVCPECRKKIVKLDAPNRILVNMANEVKVKCDECGWVGARESTSSHRCSQQQEQNRTAPSPPPQQASHKAQQQPQLHQVQYQMQNNPPRPQQQQPPQRIQAIEAHGARPWETYGLTQMEYDQIFSIFMHFDSDDSGELDKRELQRLARWLNFAHTDHDIDMMFRQMDTDGSGSLSMTEFCTWLKFNKPDPQSLYGMSQMDYNYVLMQFHSFDENNTGELDPRQFIQLCTSNHYTNSADEAMRLFQKIDSDGNGTLSLHEFLTYRAQHTQSVRVSAPPRQQQPPMPTPYQGGGGISPPPQQQQNAFPGVPTPGVNYYDQQQPPMGMGAPLPHQQRYPQQQQQQFYQPGPGQPQQNNLFPPMPQPQQQLLPSSQQMESNIQQIQNIFPSVPRQRLEQLLLQNNHNVDAAINALLESGGTMNECKTDSNSRQLLVAVHKICFLTISKQLHSAIELVELKLQRFPTLFHSWKLPAVRF